MFIPFRFGSFEIFKPQDAQTGRAGPSVNHKDILPTMLDYVIKFFYPEVFDFSKIYSLTNVIRTPMNRIFMQFKMDVLYPSTLARLSKL